MSTTLYNKIVGKTREMTFDVFMSVVRAINNAHEMGLPKAYDTRFENFCSQPTWVQIVSELDLAPIPGGQIMYVVTRTEGVYLSSVPGDHIEFDKHSILVKALTRTLS